MSHNSKETVDYKKNKTTTAFLSLYCIFATFKHKRICTTSILKYLNQLCVLLAKSPFRICIVMQITHLNDLLGVQPEIKVPKDKVWQSFMPLVGDPVKHCGR